MTSRFQVGAATVRPGPAERWERRLQLAAHPIAYPLLRAASRGGPVVRIPRVGVLVNDAGLAREVLLDNDTFTKDGPGSPADLWTPVVGPSVLLNMEGTAHGDLRRKLLPLFSPSSVGGLCGRIGPSHIRQMVDRLTGQDAVDLVPVVRTLAASMIAALVGLDEDPGTVPLESVLASAGRVTSLVRLGRRGLTAAQVDLARGALSELTGPAVAAWHHGDPGTVPGRMRELGLSETEAAGAVAAFVLVGTETLISFLPRLIALTMDSGWWPRLSADPNRYDRVLAEGLRFTVPSPVMLRAVARPSSVGRFQVRPGDRVVIATATAARTSATFDPDSGEAAPLRRLWFGAGPHFCLGMPLATAQIDLLIQALLDTDRDAGPLVIRDRAVSRRVLIPGYRRLVIGRG